jgi:hypothetical protein
MIATITPQAALALGWSVIPCGPHKKPLLTRWRPYQTRRPMFEELTAWLSLKPAIWALITGAISGRICLDFDGDAGRQTLKRLGLQPHRRTPSGGFHVDFWHPGWHVATLNGKSKRELGARRPGLDIRGDGGYVCFSGHTDRGEYAWLRDPQPDPLDILPTELRGLLGLLRPPALAPEQPPDDSHHPIPACGQVDSERLVRMALNHVAGNGRNNAGFWLCVQLRDNGYPRAEAAIIMRNYHSRCSAVNTKGHREPYTEQEVRATLRQTYARPPREPWRRRAAFNPCTAHNHVPEVA